MAIGATLKAAREAKGLTVAGLANELHLKAQVVEDLERDDFQNIKASIYGRGFIRLCAERLGLDPAPLLAEFATVYQKQPHESAPYGTAEYRRLEELARTRAAEASRPPKRPAPARTVDAPEAEPRPMAQPEAVTPSVTVLPAVPLAQPSPRPIAEDAPLFRLPSAGTPTPTANPAGEPHVAVPEPPHVATPPPTPETDDGEDTLFPMTPRTAKTVSVDSPAARERPRTGRFVPPPRATLFRDERPPRKEGPGALRRAASAAVAGTRRAGGATFRAVGSAASATGAFVARHVRVLAMGMAALLMACLATWAVFGIHAAVRDHRARHPAAPATAIAKTPAAAPTTAPSTAMAHAVLVLPPPALYAE